jgi:hypothetical protein
MPANDTPDDSSALLIDLDGREPVPGSENNSATTRAVSDLLGSLGMSPAQTEDCR